METKDEQIVVESTTVQNNVVSGEQSGLDDNIIKDGDMIVIYLDPLNTSCINVKKGVRFQNKYGHYNHDDIIGKQYGSKVRTYKEYPIKTCLLSRSSLRMDLYTYCDQHPL